MRERETVRVDSSDLQLYMKHAGDEMKRASLISNSKALYTPHEITTKHVQTSHGDRKKGTCDCPLKAEGTFSVLIAGYKVRWQLIREGS